MEGKLMGIVLDIARDEGKRIDLLCISRGTSERKVRLEKGDDEKQGMGGC